jgi:hypothetical protein
VNAPFTQEMIKKYGESLARSKPEAIEFQFQIGKSPWKTKNLMDYQPQDAQLDPQTPKGQQMLVQADQIKKLKARGKKIDDFIIKQ